MMVEAGSLGLSSGVSVPPPASVAMGDGRPVAQALVAALRPMANGFANEPKPRLGRSPLPATEELHGPVEAVQEQLGRLLINRQDPEVADGVL